MIHIFTALLSIVLTFVAVGTVLTFFGPAIVPGLILISIVLTNLIIFTDKEIKQ